MMDTLPWATLAVCLGITLARLPGAIRGHNRSLFWIFALITLAILLSIEGPYLAIDSRLGGVNLTNLILRFVLYATFLAVGVKAAKAFGSPAGERAIRGPAGLSVLGLVAALTVWFFVVSDTQGSTAGLSALTWGPSLEAYAALGRFYPAYVAVCLIPGIWRTVASPGPALLRIAAVLLVLGFSLLVVSQLFPLIPPPLRWLMALINYSAALSIAMGLAGIGVSKAVARRRNYRREGLAANALRGKKS